MILFLSCDLILVDVAIDYDECSHTDCCEQFALTLVAASAAPVPLAT